MKCAACSEEIQDDALKCRHCGTILISSDWQRFSQRYANMDEAQRARAWKQLSAEQQATLSRFMTVVQPSAASVPVVQPRKRASCTSVGCAVLVALFLIGLAMSQFNKSASTPVSGPAQAPTVSREEAVLRNVKLVNFSWSKGGFENIMMANFTIANRNDVAVKDITIECQHAGKSGTLIDSNTRTIYDVIKPKSKKAFHEFNMGFIHTQAARSVCSIKAVALAE